MTDRILWAVYRGGYLVHSTVRPTRREAIRAFLFLGADEHPESVKRAWNIWLQEMRAGWVRAAKVRVTDPNEPAHPCDDYNNGYPVLTKRELFAAMAMQGLISSPMPEGTEYSLVARMALNQADALITELNK